MMNNLPTARQFFAQYWQKKPLLSRAASVECATVLDRARMLALACRDDVESRLVIGARKTWRVEHGPFRKRDFAHLPPRNWTLLVNGLENVVPAARRLQESFRFIPYARHDDVMASYAVPGGSVGPHFDSYDVVLLQGSGTRRWQVSAQRDLALIEGAPLKILRRFAPQRAWTARAGDLLYLPPRYAHYGVAATECITWSIGFRAPDRQEMVECFLDYLRDHLRVPGAYQDRDLGPQRHPAVIGEDMLRKVGAMVKSIRWTRADIERCLGEYLTEPRRHVVFEANRRLSAARFAALCTSRGVQLALKTRMLVHDRRIFINGESVAVGAGARDTLRGLADRRFLPPCTRVDAATRALLYAWHRAGYVEPGNRVEAK